MSIITIVFLLLLIAGFICIYLQPGRTLFDVAVLVVLVLMLAGVL